VTVLALFSAAAVVRIILSVAAETGRWCGSEGFVFMTVGARDFLVPAQQRVVGHFVIKFDFLPFISTVTIATLRAGKTIMHVVFTVTGNAIRRGLAVLRPCLMAAIAGDFPVAPEQWEVGEVVIKSIFVEGDNRKPTPFVIRVAICATAVPRLTEATMKSDRLFYVSADVFMTRNAKCSLLASRKQFMTG